MATVSAEMLEVVVGTDNPTTHTLALYTKDGIRFAMFAAQRPESESWFPIPLPTEFAENDVLFQEFTADLAIRGYILDTCSARLQ